MPCAQAGGEHRQRGPDFELDDLGSLTYPQCAFAGCAPVSRTVSPGYTHGFLTSVPGWATAISYHANGMLNQVTHASTAWSAFKDYIYRGTQLLASAHSAEGIRHFHLDHLGTPRLVTAAGTGGDFHTLAPCRVLDTRTPSAPLSAGETRTVPMSGICGIPGNAAAVAVNITVADATSSGEMTAYPGNETRPTTSAISYQAAVNRANNAILKLGNGALAFYNNQPSGSAYLIIDVNGYFTEDAGAVVAYHAYYPFGEEATAFNQDAEQMKFTGHERDLGNLAGAGDDLDYMHARHCSPMTGRFHSVDPTMESADPFVPQSWNRYNYVQSNPLVYVDPTGELLVFAGSLANLEKLRKLVNDSLHGYELVINRNGTAQLVSNNAQGPASPEQAALAGALSAAINRSEVIRIGVESGASDVLVGNYVLEAIDLHDIAALGSGPAVSSSSTFAHEIIEQTAKQVFGLTNTEKDEVLAHSLGTAAQDLVSGFTRGRTNRDLLNRNTGNGYTLTEQSKGNQTVTVIIKWVNGNIVKVVRK